jgi:hypothetical protein
MKGFFQMVLEYLRVFLSWPAVVLALGVFFLMRFKEPVKALIDRAASIKLPGGSELMFPQTTLNALNARTADETEAAPLGVGVEQVQIAVNDQQPDVPAPEVAALEQRLRSERERAYLWEYRFLNYYLAPGTQIVLEWLASREPTNFATYDNWIMNQVRNPVERFAMIEALRNHHLLRVDDTGLMSVTPKAREYMEWRGPLSEFLSARSAVPKGERTATITEPPPTLPETNARIMHSG